MTATLFGDDFGGGDLDEDYNHGGSTYESDPYPVEDPVLDEDFNDAGSIDGYDAGGTEETITETESFEEWNDPFDGANYSYQYTYLDGTIAPDYGLEEVLVTAYGDWDYEYATGVTVNSLFLPAHDEGSFSINLQGILSSELRSDYDYGRAYTERSFYYTYYKPNGLEDHLTEPKKGELRQIPILILGLAIWFVKVTVVELGRVLFLKSVIRRPFWARLSVP